MAIFEVVEGAPGQGKSLYLARLTLKLLQRNKKYHELGYPIRKVALNIKLADFVEKEWGSYIVYWTSLEDICQFRDIDLIWDEIATELDSRNWQNLSAEVQRFLSQYRKRGIDIYANTQDFSMIDARARLMITHVYTLTKVAGSRDISTTKPPPRHIWGLILVRQVVNYKETNPEKKKYAFMPSFFFIEKELIDLYDTRQDIAQGKYPPLRKIVRECPEDGYKKVTYV